MDSVIQAPHTQKILEGFCQMLCQVTWHVNCCSLWLFHFFKWNVCVENIKVKNIQSFINLHKTLNFSFSLPYAVCSNCCLPVWWIAFILSFVLTWMKLFCRKSIYTWGKKSNNLNSVLISSSRVYNKDSNSCLKTPTVKDKIMLTLSH